MVVDMSFLYQLHPGRKLKTLQPAPGGGIGVVEW